jgi:elongator complex protein 3
MTYEFDYTSHTETLVPLLKELEVLIGVKPKNLSRVVKKYPKSNGNQFSKDELVVGYRALAGSHGLKPFSDTFLEKIRMKPIRTQSGVAPITVLTKPFPCPGKCIFCPSDIRQPKSYLSDEPGAQRAERNWFDPYLQTYNRLQALSNIGHNVSKAEVIVLGGTWSFYPEKYQIWFIKECFRALNDFGKKDGRQEVENRYAQLKKNLELKSDTVMGNDPKKNAQVMDGFKIEGDKIDKTYNQTVSQLYVAPEKLGGYDQYQTASWQELFKVHKTNEKAKVRCVGLVVETRPDNISETEVLRVRKLGCTKVQIGFQSLNDDVLRKNKRGHLVNSSVKAVKLLRQAGFKIHAHWMANLHGSSVELDKKDYQKLFDDFHFRPDELKIYPCSLIGSAELMQYYKKGLWKPYEYEELLEVLSFCLLNTPEYCRLTRVIRDIPSTDIVEGNKFTNFRQIAQQKLEKAGKHSVDIRAREIRGQKFDPEKLEIKPIIYKTPIGSEVFLQYVTPENKIVAFLRLSLPKTKSFIEELHDSALIREVHVYGKLLDVGETSGKNSSKKAQHLGLGRQLIELAKKISSDKGYKKLAVISAVGTREYYRKLGFVDGDLYQFVNIKAQEARDK